MIFKIVYFLLNLFETIDARMQNFGVFCG